MNHGTLDTRGDRRLMVAAAIGLAALLLVAMAILPRIDALANHPGHCPESEPGENNGPTVVIGTTDDDLCLVGANGPDIMKGKGGNDVLIGNHGPDKLRGGLGDDIFWGGRGPDTFICGPGEDLVHNDRSTGADVMDDSCEVVT